MTSPAPNSWQIPAILRPSPSWISLTLRRMCTTLFLVVTTVAVSQAAMSATVTRSGKENAISGNVQPATVQGVQRDFSAADGRTIDTLVVNSTGGDLKSMVALGHILALTSGPSPI